MQASTKIYRNPAALPSGHQTRATLEAGSLLVCAPDPVQAFAGYIYAQRQEFHLAPVFGAVMRSLDIPHDTVARLFVFTHLRSVIAAGVRASRRVTCL